MKNIWILTKTNMKRNKAALILALLSALLLCYMLNAMGKLSADRNQSVNIGVIDNDKSVLSSDFKDYLTKELNYTLLENYTYDQLSEELIDKNISVIIEIPEGFYSEASQGKMEDITVTSLDDYENAAFFQAYVNTYLGSIKQLSDSAAGSKEVFDKLLTNYQNEKITLTQTSAQTIDKQELKEMESFNASVGFFLMFIFGLGVFAAFLIMDDRYFGVFRRIKITTVKPVQYVIGSGIFGLLLCFIEVAVYCGYIKLIDYHVGFPFGLMVLMMSLFAIFTVCFSITMALTITSKSALAMSIIAFSTIGDILGGGYFPIDLAPQNLKNMAKILPQYWFMDTFRRMQADASANIFPNIIILTLFTLLAFLIGAVLFSQNYKNS